MSLALGVPVRELQARTTSSEFAEYLAFFSREPWPDQRGDYHAALLASVLVRVLTDGEAEPSDFLPDYWGGVGPSERGPQEQSEIEKQLASLAEAFPDMVRKVG